MSKRIMVKLEGEPKEIEICRVPDVFAGLFASMLYDRGDVWYGSDVATNRKIELTRIVDDNGEELVDFKPPYVTCASYAVTLHTQDDEFQMITFNDKRTAKTFIESIEATWMYDDRKIRKIDFERVTQPWQSEQ